MSYTTRCPACGTTFKVVPDQLKISDGWVRCGHCADVFDATLYLQAWTPPPPPPPPVPSAAAAPPAVEAPAPVSVKEDDPAPEPGPHAPQADTSYGSAPPPERAFDEAPAWGQTMPADLRSETGGPALSEPVAPPADAPSNDGQPRARDEAAVTSPVKPDRDAAAKGSPLGIGPPLSTTAADEWSTDFHAELARFAETAGRTASDEAPVPPAAEPLPASASAPAMPDLPMPDEGMAGPEAAEPGFVRQARRQAFWRSPPVRAALAVLAVLLGGLLGAQWAVHERDALAASHPQFAPLLSQLCAPLGCEIGPVRRIDAVVIDSSTLARRLGNFYAFDVVIKNTAPIPVAVPALELSLTDTRDSVIARRVFLQSELPGAPVLLPPQGSLPLSLRLSITDAGALSMAGYRALVFYP